MSTTTSLNSLELVKKPIDELKKQDLEHLQSEVKLAANARIDTREFILTVNNALGSGHGMKVEELVNLPGPAISCWYHLVDNITNLPRFSTIAVLPGREVGKKDDQILLMYKASSSDAGAIRIKVFSLLG